MTNVLLHGLWSRWGHGIPSWKQPSSRAYAWLDGKKNFIYFISLVFSLSQTKLQGIKGDADALSLSDFEMSLGPWATAVLCFGSTFVTELVCWMWCVKKYKLGFRFEWAHERFPYGGGFFWEVNVKPIKK